MCACVPMEAEEHVQGLPLPLSTLLCETGTLTEPVLGRLAGQQAPRICLSPFCTFYVETREHWVSSSFSNLFLETECLPQRMWSSHTWLDGAQKACGIIHAGVQTCAAVPSVSMRTGKPNSDLMPVHQALSHLPSTSTRLFIACFENRVLLCKLGWPGKM